MLLSEAVKKIAVDRGWSDTHAYNCSTTYDQFMRFIGDLELDDISPADLDAFRSLHDFSEGTWRFKVFAIRALYREYLPGHKILDDQPPPVNVKYGHSLFHSDQVEALIEFRCSVYWEFRAKALACLCLDGVPLGVALGLNVDDVHEQYGVAHASGKIVLLSRDTAQAMTDWKRVRRQKGGEISLFTSSYGTAMVKQSVSLSNFLELATGRRGGGCRELNLTHVAQVAIHCNLDINCIRQIAGVRLDTAEWIVETINSLYGSIDNA